MRYATQDPKFDIEDGKLINAATCVPIPADEPIFIMRAKDRKAEKHIWQYSDDCEDGDHKSAVHDRAEEFHVFSVEHPERMKEPDTTPNK